MQETNTHPANCPECGSAPGECYLICPNSPGYYSPEQEREDALAFEAAGSPDYELQAAMRREADDEADAESRFEARQELAAHDAHLEADYDGYWE